jgi:hypothetical protein
VSGRAEAAEASIVDAKDPVGQLVSIYDAAHRGPTAAQAHRAGLQAVAAFATAAAWEMFEPGVSWCGCGDLYDTGVDECPTCRFVTEEFGSEAQA